MSDPWKFVPVKRKRTNGTEYDAKALRNPRQIALGPAYWVWQHDLTWLMDLLKRLPRRHGLNLQLLDGTMNPNRPLSGPQLWRLCPDGRFQHGRIAGANKSRPGRIRWHDEWWAVSECGLWYRDLKELRQPEVVVNSQIPSWLTDWLKRLEVEATRLEVIGEPGLVLGCCSLCSRPLEDEIAKKRGIGNDCWRHLNSDLANRVLK